MTDVHQRTHRSLVKLLEHSAGFSSELLAQELEGFGYPSIRLQLHHVMGAEQYWVGVLRGLMLVDELEEDYASIDALRAFRQRVAGVTAEYLRGASEAELNTSRKVIAWGPREIAVVPAQVILRTQTHIFQHQGQVAAMARLLGRPIPPGLDFPLT
ncbi:MAG: DinB family protein [Planctomycetes bacterium]|nr:DinB family protein [Planctomycetota bacterium]MCB9934320.1 DinB family protein [Planctomycetota bacterium]